MTSSFKKWNTQPLAATALIGCAPGRTELWYDCQNFYFNEYLWQTPHSGLPGPRNLLAMPAAREESVTREGFAEPLGFARLTPDRK